MAAPCVPTQGSRLGPGQWQGRALGLAVPCPRGLHGAGGVSSPTAASRGGRLPLCTDRHHSHGGGPQGGGPARADPGGAAARAGAEEAGGPAVRRPDTPPTGQASTAMPAALLWVPGCLGSVICGLLAAGWAWPVPWPAWVGGRFWGSCPALPASGARDDPSSGLNMSRDISLMGGAAV